MAHGNEKIARSPGVPSRRQRRRRRRRLALRLMAYGALLVVALASPAWWYPVRSSWMDDLLSAQLASALDGQVRFDSAVYYLGRGLAEFEGVSISRADGTTSAPAQLDLEAVMVTFDPWSWMWRGAGRIHRIDLIRPSPLEVQVDLASLSVSVSPPLGRLEGRGGGALSVGEIHLEQVDVAVRLMGEDRQTSRTALHATNAQLHVRFSDGDPTFGAGPQVWARALGDRMNGRSVPWQGQVRYAPDAGRLEYEMTMDQWSAPEGLEALALSELEFQRPRLTGSVSVDRGLAREVSGRFSFRSGEALVAGQDGAWRLCDAESMAQGEWRYTGEDGALEARDITVALGGAEARLSGRASLGDGPRWTVALEDGRLSRQCVQMALDLWGPDWPVTLAEDAVWQMGAAADSGDDWRSIRPRSAWLRAGGLGLTGAARDLGLDDGELFVEYSPQRLTIRSATASLHEGFLNVSGAVRGDLFSTDTLDADLLFTADGTLENLVTALARRADVGGQPLDAAGELSVLGRWRQRIDRSDPATGPRFDPPQINAGIQLTAGRLAHPRLPLPITSIQGDLIARENLVAVERLQGVIGETHVDLDGRIEGDGYIWRDPTLSLDLGAALEVAQAVDMLPEPARQAARRWRPQGVAQMQGAVRGRLARLEDLDVSARLQFQQAQARIELGDVASSLTDGEGALAYSGQDQTFRLERFTGRLGAIPFSADGLLTPEQLALNLSATADLQEAQRISGRLMRDFDVDGTLLIEARLRKNLPGDAEAAPGANRTWQGPTTQRWLQELEAYARDGFLGRDRPDAPATGTAPAPSPAAAPTVWISMRGQEGFTFTHHNMPQALSNIRGEFFFIDGVLFAQDAQADFGINRDVMVRSFAIQSPAPRHARLWFELEGGEVDATNWLVPWRKRPRGSALILPEAIRAVADQPGAAPPRFWTTEIAGTVRADMARWNRRRVERTFVRISHQRRPDLRCDLRIDGSGQTYGGQTTAAINLFSQDREPIRWQMRSSFDQVQVAGLLADTLTNPTAHSVIRGAASGYLDMAGESDRRDTFTGRGRVRIERLDLIDNRVLMEVASVLSLGGLFNAVTFDHLRSDLGIADGMIILPNLYMINDALRIDAAGSVGFDRDLDLNVTVNPFQDLPLPGVPIVSQITEFAKDAVGMIVRPILRPVFRPAERLFEKAFQTRVTGTLDTPSVGMAPFAAERSETRLFQDVDRIRTGRLDSPIMDVARIPIPETTRPE